MPDIDFKDRNYILNMLDAIEISGHTQFHSNQQKISMRMAKPLMLQ
jgi:hypothetical protein